jgi:hypothetical protein
MLSNLGKVGQDDRICCDNFTKFSRLTTQAYASALLEHQSIISFHKCMDVNDCVHPNF